MDRPGTWTGALVGLLLTAALTAVLYLAHKAAGLPFLPFDTFDALARLLPGAMVTFGIDVMVSVIRALGTSDLSAAAKTAEQAMAIGALLGAGTLAGAAVFALLRRRPAWSAFAAGLAAGAVLAVPALLAGRVLEAGTATTGPLASTAWTLAALLGWGAALGWAHRRLTGPKRAAAAPPAPAAVEAEPIDRRRFLVRLGGATAAVTVAGAVVGRRLGRRSPYEAALERAEPWSATHPLPNAQAAVAPVPGTRPELTPVPDHYRIDINTRPPVVEEASWRLRVGGRVERPTELTLDALRGGYPARSQLVTLSCISNPIGGDLIGTTRWTGLSLAALLPDLRLRPDATHLRIESADGFYEVVALEDVRADPRIMLVYAWDGLPLPTEHGFPLRVYIPDRYGMKQPKWIERIEAVDRWEAGYWVERGWDREARVKATSVVDVVGPEPLAAPDGSRLVPVGGIAYAGARGVSRVALSVDGGPWRDAELRDPLSDLTWVIWRYAWPFEPGEHTFAVRCWDGDGVPQVMADSPIRPSGATGIHDVQAEV